MPTELENRISAELVPDEYPFVEGTGNRVYFVAELMADHAWLRGVSRVRLAKAWAVTENAIDGYAAEAHRLLNNLGRKDVVMQRVGLALDRLMRTLPARDLVPALRLSMEYANLLKPTKDESKPDEVEKAQRELLAEPPPELLALMPPEIQEAYRARRGQP